MTASLGVALHVTHIAGKPLVQPIAQAIEAVRRRSGSDARQLKAKDMALLFETIFQGMHGSYHSRWMLADPVPRDPLLKSLKGPARSRILFM
jgi:hypothetical protein